MLSIIAGGWVTTISLIFGGCCSNAITLEQLTTEYPLSGSLITAFQFLIISLHGIPTHIAWTRYGPRFKPHRIPLTSYLVQVALFYLISLLNNAAFSYRIPMSVHIIFRSGGLVISMLLGWLVSGKRYTLPQVSSVLAVTLGVVLTTLSASGGKSTTSHDPSANTNLYTYLQGISILTLALLLSGFLGLVQDYTSEKTAPGAGATPTPPPTPPQATWQESMFYLHFLALPMFFFVRRDIATQLASSRPPFLPFLSDSSSSPITLTLHGALDLTLPHAYLPLLLNTVTQLVCVAGVHRLTTRVSALSVTLVLVVRKAVSLIISVWMARGGGGGGAVDYRLMWTGAGLVLMGTVGYSVATGRAKEKLQKQKQKTE
ncbi:UAA transporter, partial [Mycena galopus ATCC 62051]